MVLHATKLLVLSIVLARVQAKQTYNIAIVPKNLNNADFFGLAYRGCRDAAQTMDDTVNCWFNGTQEVNVTQTVDILDQLILDDDCSAIAVSVVDARAYAPVINRAIAANKPIFTFDSDSPRSNRLSYIGTNNYLMGRALGKVLNEVQPKGGTYGILSGFGDNLAERVRGVREYLSETNWVEVGQPKNGREDVETSLKMMNEWVAEFSTLGAVVGVVGLPMLGQSSRSWIEFVQKNPRLRTIMADTLPKQLNLMQMGHADGLVGQRPYAMGYEVAMSSVSVLNDMVVDGKAIGEISIEDVSHGTHLLEVLKIPANSSLNMRLGVDVAKGEFTETTFKGMSIRLTNVTSSLNRLEIGYLERIFEQWFEEYYHEEEFDAVRMGYFSTHISVQAQNFEGTVNTIGFDQTVAYFAFDGALEPRDYVLIPYLHARVNKNLVESLISRLGSAYKDIASPLGNPVFNDVNEESLAGGRGNGGTVTVGTLLGVVVAVIVSMTLAFTATLYRIGLLRRKQLAVQLPEYHPAAPDPEVAATSPSKPSKTEAQSRRTPERSQPGVRSQSVPPKLHANALGSVELESVPTVEENKPCGAQAPATSPQKPRKREVTSRRTADRTQPGTRSQSVPPKFHTNALGSMELESVPTLAENTPWEAREGL